MASNEVAPNLINSSTGENNQVMGLNGTSASAHGGKRRGSGRKPASAQLSKTKRRAAEQPRRIKKAKDESNLRVLGLWEEQRYWRKALVTAAEAATAEPDQAKVMLASSSTLMNGLRAISELRRGRAWVAPPPAPAANDDLSRLLRGLVPSEVKTQRKRDAADPSTQKEPGVDLAVHSSD